MITEFLIKICHPNKNPMIQPMCLISALLAHAESTRIQLAAMSKLNHELSISTKTFSYKDPLADTNVRL